MTSHTTRFKHIFDNQKGAADILLQTSMDRSSLSSSTYPGPRMSRATHLEFPKAKSSERYAGKHSHEPTSIGLPRVKNKLHPEAETVFKRLTQTSNHRPSHLNVNFVTYARHLVDEAIHAAVLEFGKPTKDFSNSLNR